MLKHDDILLDADLDLDISNGDFTVGDSVVQEIEALVTLNQGELKSDPKLGPNLVKFMKSTARESEIKSAMKLHLSMDGKNYEEVKHIVGLIIKKQ